MRKSFVLPFALLACTSPIGVAWAKSVHSDFVEAWTTRDQRYREQQVLVEKQAKEAADALVASPNADANALEERKSRFLDSLFAHGSVQGQATLLGQLRRHMAKKPSGAQTDLWLQEQIASLRSDSDAVARRFENLKTGASGDYGRDVVATVFASGGVRGRIEELRLIEQNLATYYSAKGAEKAQRQQARAAFLQALSRLGETNSDSSWSATCRTSLTGTTTTCQGN